MQFYDRDEPISANISEDYKFLVFPPMRTGARTIISFFKNYYNMMLMDDKGHCHSDMAGTHWPNPPEYTKSYIKILSIRNPFTRATSFYFWFKLLQEKGRHNQEEKIFFPDVVFSNFIIKKEYVDRFYPDFYIRLENLKEDLLKISFIEEINSEQSEHLENHFKSEHRDDWKNLYYDNPGSEQKVLDFFESDFELGNYSIKLEDAIQT